MIYCGIHQKNHSVAEWAACLASHRPAEADGESEPGR